MAVGIFMAAVEQDAVLVKTFSSSSAGIYAEQDCHASDSAIRGLEEDWEIDICSHKSRILKEEDIKNAFLVLTMTRDHKAIITSRMPKYSDKIFTLKEYVQNKSTDISTKEYDYRLDIMDPYGNNGNEYRKCAEEIGIAVDKLISKLKAEC